MLPKKTKQKIINESDKKVNQLEIQCASEIRSFFLNLEKELLNELSPTTTDNDLRHIIDTNWETYTNIIYEYQLKAHKLGVNLHQLITKPVNKPVTKALPIIPFTIEWEVFSYAQISSRYVRLRYGKLVSDALIEGYESGKGITVVTELLQKVNNNFKNYEAHRIARTEIQSARGRAIHEQMVDEGVEYKQWLTMQDELVRGNKPTDNADHVSLDGLIVPVNEPFPNGLQYPGDKDGPISEWINCRCTSVPYILLPNETGPLDKASFYENEIIRM